MAFLIMVCGIICIIGMIKIASTNDPKYMVYAFMISACFIVLWMFVSLLFSSCYFDREESTEKYTLDYIGSEHIYLEDQGDKYVFAYKNTSNTNTNKIDSVDKNLTTIVFSPFEGDIPTLEVKTYGKWKSPWLNFFFIPKSNKSYTIYLPLF